MVFSPTENTVSSLPRPAGWNSVLVQSGVAKHCNKWEMSVSLRGSSQYKKLQDWKHLFTHCFPCTSGILLVFHQWNYSLFLEITNSTCISIFTSNFKKIYRRKEMWWIILLLFSLVASTDWSSNTCLWHWVWCSDKWNSWPWFFFFFQSTAEWGLWGGSDLWLTLTILANKANP